MRTLRVKLKNSIWTRVTSLDYIQVQLATASPANKTLIEADGRACANYRPTTAPDLPHPPQHSTPTLLVVKANELLGVLVGWPVYWQRRLPKGGRGYVRTGSTNMTLGRTGAWQSSFFLLLIPSGSSESRKIVTKKKIASESFKKIRPRHDK